MAVESFDAEQIHRRFVGLAEEMSPALAGDLRSLGPIVWPERDAASIGLFLARAVIGQQLSTKVARVIWSRVEALAAATGGDPLAAFAPANAEALRTCGASRAKVKALAAIREAELAGWLDEGALRAMTAEERARQLKAIWGIGQWTCDMAAIFHFRDLDIWPEGDLAVRNTFARYIGRRKPARAAARFAPQRSVLALYLWAIMDRMPAQQPAVTR
jgi:DNA-3-methyladenine glycosylase II